jgi:hypothetical protein
MLHSDIPAAVLDVEHGIGRIALREEYMAFAVLRRHRAGADAESVRLQQERPGQTVQLQVLPIRSGAFWEASDKISEVSSPTWKQ